MALGTAGDQADPGAMTTALPDLLIDGPAAAPWTVALAHGAGAPMDSPFMATMAALLAAHGLRIVRFEFPYMARRRIDGRRQPPDRQPLLLDCWRRVIDHLGPDRLVVGGKSMGGRMASLLADEAEVSGLVCLGYPFHPPGKPEKLRTDHLQALRTPTLICQGERDPFGTRDEVGAYPLSRTIRIEWLPDGDHSLKPRKMSGHSEEGNLANAADAIAVWAAGL